MNWLVQRYSGTDDSTLGLLFKEIVMGQSTKLHFFGDTMEDEFREVKVSGETRIPAGKYELKILRLDTPLTIKHRKDYGAWFSYHIEICNIPNFKGVYIHSGNTDDHTDGCLLIGYGSQKINGIQSINNSKLAIKDFYNQVYEHLDKGNQAWITIRDEETLNIKPI